MSNNRTNEFAPVITIDGPSGTGKGTLSMLLAERLRWHYLDSGALYRVIALAMIQQKVSFQQVAAIIELIQQCDIQFAMDQAGMEKKVILDGQDVTKTIRSEQISQASSKVSAIAEVRAALTERQRAFRVYPGLVTDGRDMGTVIFPDARLKIFMTASAKVRAERRYKQLKNKGIDGNLAAILKELNERDVRDRQRSVAPLKPAGDAVQIDTSDLSVEEVYQRLWQLVQIYHLTTGS